TLAVAAITFGCAGSVALRKEVRISTRKRHRVEGSKSGAYPLAMPLLLCLVRAIDERGEYLDEHMVATKAERRRLEWYPRGSTPKFVGKDGATRGDSCLHRLNKDVDTAAIERRKPACLHERSLPIDKVWVERGQGSAVGFLFYCAGE